MRIEHVEMAGDRARHEIQEMSGDMIADCFQHSQKAFEAVCVDLSQAVARAEAETRARGLVWAWVKC